MVFIPASATTLRAMQGAESGLAAFVAGLAAITPEEQQKAKILYVKNLMTSFEAWRDGMKATMWAMIPFTIVTVAALPFLPFILKSISIEKRCKLQIIENAVIIWGNDLTPLGVPAWLAR